MPPPRPLSIFCWLSACSAALFFSYLNVIDPAVVGSLFWEHGWVENLTAIGLFLAGLLLFATAWMERNFARRCVYILGGLAMVFGAGEEIDRGQRIFFMFDVGPQQAHSVHARFGWLFHEPISKSFEQDTDGCEVDESEEILRIVLPSNENPTLPLQP